MFPSRLLRGIDLAIEFATLGEYGLEPAPAPAAPAGFQVDLSGIGGSRGTPGAPGRLAPATPAARRLEAVREPRPAAKPPLSSPLASRRALRAGTFGPARSAAAGKRKRAGAPPVRPQPCLVAEGRQPAA